MLTKFLVRLCLKYCHFYSGQFLLLVCFIAGLVIPVMLVMSLRIGYVSDTRAQLLADPRGLSLFPQSFDVEFDQDWIDRKAAHPLVRFISPRLSPFNAMVKVCVAQDCDQTLQIIATGPGDPMFLDLAVPQGPGQIGMTETAAEQLGLAVGSVVTLTAARAGKQWHAETAVVSLVPRARESLPVLFVDAQVLHALEQFRADSRGLGALPTRYSSWRMYAGTLEDVLVLQAELEAEGLQIRSDSERIADLFRMRNLLDAVVWGVTGTIGVCGSMMLVFLFSNVVLNARRSISLLHLSGVPRFGCAVLPALMAAAVSGLGVMLGVLGWQALAITTLQRYGSAYAVLPLVEIITIGAFVAVLCVSTTMVVALRLLDKDTWEGMSYA